MNCPICYNETKLTLECKHPICQSCARIMKKPSCPLCRKTVALYEVSGGYTRSDRKQSIETLTELLNEFIIVKNLPAEYQFNKILRVYTFFCTHHGNGLIRNFPSLKLQVDSKIYELIEQVKINQSLGDKELSLLQEIPLVLHMIE